MLSTLQTPREAAAQRSAAGGLGMGLGIALHDREHLKLAPPWPGPFDQASVFICEQGGKWGSLPLVTQLGSSRGGAQTQVCEPPEPMTLTAAPNRPLETQQWSQVQGSGRPA